MSRYSAEPVSHDSLEAAGLHVRMQQLFSGSALVFFGLLLRTGLLLVFELLIARHLGPASYGLFSLAFTVVVIMSKKSRETFLKILSFSSGPVIA